MKAVILAGGEGTRLGMKVPKCLVQVGEETLLHRHLRNLSRLGIDDVTVVYGSLGKDEIFRELDRFDIGLSISRLYSPTSAEGSLGSFAIGLSQVIDSDENVVFMNSNMFVEEHLYDVIVEEGEDTKWVHLFYDCGKKTNKEAYMAGGMPYGAVGLQLGKVALDITYWGESLGWYVMTSDAMKGISKIIAREKYLEQSKMTIDYEVVINSLIREEPSEFLDICSYDWINIIYPQDLVKAILLEEQFRGVDI